MFGFPYTQPGCQGLQRNMAPLLELGPVLPSLSTSHIPRPQLKSSSSPPQSHHNPALPNLPRLSVPRWLRPPLVAVDTSETATVLLEPSAPPQALRGLIRFSETCCCPPNSPTDAAEFHFALKVPYPCQAEARQISRYTQRSFICRLAPPWPGTRPRTLARKYGWHGEF